MEIHLEEPLPFSVPLSLWIQLENQEPDIRIPARYRQFTPSGLRPEDADAMVPALIEFAATPRTSQELQRWIAERFGGESPPGCGLATNPLARQPPFPSGTHTLQPRAW